MRAAQWSLSRFDASVLSVPEFGRYARLAGVVAIASAAAVFAFFWRTDANLLRKTPHAEIHTSETVRTAPRSPAPGRHVLSNQGTTSVSSAGKSPASLSKLDREMFEFTLAKSRRLRPLAGVQIGLLRTDVRRATCRVTLVAAGKQERKEMRLNEPVVVWVGQKPVEFVIKAISRNAVSGYVSEPRQQAGLAPSSSAR